MYRNRIYLVFLGMLTIAALFFSSKSLYHLYIYSQLQANTIADQTSWSLDISGDEEVYLKGDYSFIVNGTTFHAETDKLSPAYRNQWATERAIQENQHKQWRVWYNPSHPQNSSLIRTFPLKELISSAILWGLTLYIFALGFYVKKLKR